MNYLKLIILVAMVLPFILLYAQDTDSVSFYASLAKKNLPQADSLAVNYAQKAIEIAILSDNDSLIALAYYTQGLVYYYKGYYKASNQSYLKSVNTDYSNVNSQFRSKLFNNIGINYDILEEYDRALDYFFKSLDIEKESENAEGIAQSSINIGLVYIWQNKYVDAASFLTQARAYYEEKRDSFFLGLIFQNQVLLEYHTQKTFDAKSLDLLTDKAELCFETLENWNGLIDVYYNMSKIYNLQKVQDKELYWLNKAIQVGDRQNVYNTETILRIKLARLKLINTDPVQVEKDLTEGLRLISENGINTMQDPYFSELLQFYAKKKNTEKLISTLNKYTEAININESNTRMQTFEELSFLYNLKERENLIQIQQLELIKQKSQKIVLMLALILVIFITGGLMFFHRYRLARLKELYVLNMNSIQPVNNFITSVELQKQRDDENWSQLEWLYERIVMLLQEEKLYTEFEISIAMIADRIKTNEKYVSMAINRGSGTNFYHFINSLRINEAKHLLMNDIRRQLSLEQVMYKAGFRSRTTFTEAFKKGTGLTPGQFRKMADTLSSPNQ